MRIGELSARAGLTTKAIRFYEQVGVLPEPDRQVSGYRNYDDDALRRLRFVKAAQTAGLTLADIRAVLAVRDETGPPCQHVIELLHSHAAELDRRVADLTALRQEVGRLLHRAESLDPASCDPAVICHLIPSPAVAGPQPDRSQRGPLRPRRRAEWVDLSSGPRVPPGSGAEGTGDHTVE